MNLYVLTLQLFFDLVDRDSKEFFAEIHPVDSCFFKALMKRFFQLWRTVNNWLWGFMVTGKCKKLSSGNNKSKSEI